jgi:ABC-type antimicrobial peptide transport system permease subunit
MMLKLYAQMALASIARAKLRSLLTMLGVIIGITSVIMIFALGEGLKRQVAGQLKDVGADLVSVRSGKIVERDGDGRITKVNLSSVFAQSNLTDTDLEAVKGVAGVSAVAPVAYLTAPVSTQDKAITVNDIPLLATTPQIRDVQGRDVETGQFFTTPELEKNLIVLGADLARELYGEDSPIGRIVIVRNTEFVIRGVMQRAKASPLDIINTNLDRAAYIPTGAAKKLSGGSIAYREIGVKVSQTDSISKTVNAINQKLLEPRQGVRDFTVLEPQDFVNVLDKVFGVLTTFVAAVAAISLFVGGIGIMNIMLVSVSERTREIGIRKSIGATDQQILGQFMIEAIVLTLIGGVIGVAVSFVFTGLARLYTTFQPFIRLEVIAAALLVTMAVGVIFGIVPALKAARKDPIESLR